MEPNVYFIDFRVLQSTNDRPREPDHSSSVIGPSDPVTRPASRTKEGVLSGRADETEASVVSKTGPDALPAEPAAPRDPLADAGVMPELPAETGAPADEVQTAPATNAPLPAGVTAQ